MGSSSEEGLNTPPADAPQTLARRRTLGPLTLYRIGRVVGWSSVLAWLVLAGFAASIAYAANQVNYEGVAIAGVSNAAGNEILLSGAVGISNPGWYSIDNLHISARLVDESGHLIGNGTSLVTSVKANSQSQIAVGMPVDTRDPETGKLLTNDTTLLASAWANATYASLFSLHLVARENYAWGAPFYGLAYSLGPISSGMNGVEVVPLNISFTNHLFVPESGKLAVMVVPPSGPSCGGGNMSIPLLLQNDHLAKTINLTLTQGCQVHGGVLSLTYVSSLLTIPFPPEPIP